MTLASIARQARRHWLVILAVVALAALVVVVDPLRVAGALRRVDPAVVALMLPVALSVYAVRGVAWWVALRHLGIRISVPRAVAIMFAGRVFVLLPTGDLARVALLLDTGSTGRDAGTIAGTVTFQELTFLGLLGLGVLPRVTTRPDIALLVCVMVLAHAGIFAILLWQPAYDWAVGVVERVRIFRRFDGPLQHLRPAFVAMMAPGNLVAVVALNAVAAVLMFVLFALAVRSVGAGRIGLTEAAFVYGLAHILSGLSFLPGGLGSMEAIATGLLAAGGVPPSVGAAAAIVFRLCNDVFSAAVGGLAGLLVRRESGGEGERRDQRSRLRFGA